MYKEELENLREKLNKDIIKYVENKSKEEYKILITLSRKLDDVIVSYIKSFNKQV